ncbi:unnamed protein product [Rangifer tarandus platyrhynchus]|uniref:Uncharacterized protein n=2 Tax=Rangifer tarandus platyrhynchus TaxID=3082113 RepID=A0ABN9A2X8_RANTA|nr:unnamed protein product [Rangifer tarandus platyrhynchus]CAI9713820.1 unnamed protein product [Rangifer tarandus platyrhynchus]
MHLKGLLWGCRAMTLSHFSCQCSVQCQLHSPIPAAHGGKPGLAYAVPGLQCGRTWTREPGVADGAGPGRAGGGACAGTGSAGRWASRVNIAGAVRRGVAGEPAGRGARVGARSPAARGARGGPALRRRGPALRTPLAPAGRGLGAVPGLRPQRLGRGGRRDRCVGGRPGTGQWKERREPLQASGLQPGRVLPAAGAPAGVGAVRSVKGPGHLKEQRTWVSKACGRGTVFLPPDWHLMGAQSCRPATRGPGFCLAVAGGEAEVFPPA